MQTAILAIVDTLILLTIALVLQCGLIAVRRLAGRTALVPVRAASIHPHSRARVWPMAIKAAGLSLRAPPTLPALRRHVNPGISWPN